MKTFVSINLIVPVLGTFITSARESPVIHAADALVSEKREEKQK